MPPPPPPPLLLSGTKIPKVCAAPLFERDASFFGNPSFQSFVCVRLFLSEAAFVNKAKVLNDHLTSVWQHLDSPLSSLWH